MRGLKTRTCAADGCTRVRYGWSVFCKPHYRLPPHARKPRKISRPPQALPSRRVQLGKYQFSDWEMDEIKEAILWRSIEGQNCLHISKSLRVHERFVFRVRAQLVADGRLKPLGNEFELGRGVRHG